MKSILTVTSAADSHDLTMLATVKGELGIASSVQGNDGQITAWIHQASGIIASECNRVFARETVSEQFRPNRSMDVLSLTRYPVSSISSINENDEALAATDYEVDKESGLLYRMSNDNRTCWQYGKIVVVYIGGYDIPVELPQPIERACILLVKQMRSSATRDPMLKSQEVPGVLSQAFWVGDIGNNSLPPEVSSLIAPYRNIVI